MLSLSCILSYIDFFIFNLPPSIRLTFILLFSSTYCSFAIWFMAVLYSSAYEFYNKLVYRNEIVIRLLLWKLPYVPPRHFIVYLFHVSLLSYVNINNELTQNILIFLTTKAVLCLAFSSIFANFWKLFAPSI